MARVSPLAGFAFPAGPELRLAELPFQAQVNVRASAAPPGDTVLRLGPDEWLVVGSHPDTVRAAVGTADSVVDVSAQRTTIEITGPRARDLLRHGCALDLAAQAFPVGRCAQTMLAQAQVILVAVDGGYHVLVRSSYARYLADWLVDASIEYVTETGR